MEDDVKIVTIIQPIEVCIELMEIRGLQTVPKFGLLGHCLCTLIFLHHTLNFGPFQLNMNYYKTKLKTCKCSRFWFFIQRSIWSYFHVSELSNIVSFHTSSYENNGRGGVGIVCCRMTVMLSCLKIALCCGLKLIVLVRLPQI